MKAALALALALGLPACSRTVSDDDCRRVGDHLRDVWQAETKTTAPDGISEDKATAVIHTEGERLVTQWSTECKTELRGRRVDPKELECLLKASTIAQVAKCSEP